VHGGNTAGFCLASAAARRVFCADQDSGRAHPVIGLSAGHRMWPLMWPKRFIACDITINLLMLLTIMNYIIRYVAECPDQLCISELADHGIAGAAESDRADMPRASRQDLGSA